MATELPPDPAWEQLRRLLLTQEQLRLEQLEAELTQQRRRQHLRADLPATITQLGADEDLRSSLVEPVTAALHSSIERDRDGVASLLFPVMGPAIRRAVQESLRTVIQRINLALEYGLSPRAWRWRLQAWRTGEPFAQIVLRHSLAYSVDEIFLIHRSSGLVALRRSRTEVLALDADAVASMLTAIQSFLQQSLGSVADDPLRTVELGSATLWLVNGPEVLVAAIIRGEAPLLLREQLQETLEQAHQLLGERLTDYQGETLQDGAVCTLLDRHLTDQAPPQKQNRATRWVWPLLGVSVIMALSWLGWQQWHLNQEHRRLQQVIGGQAGLVLVRSEVRGGQIHGLLLRDPLAPTLTELGQLSELAPSRLALAEQRFLSTERPILLRRLAQMLELAADEVVIISSADGAEHLQISRPLSAPQWQRLLTALSVLQTNLSVVEPALDAAAIHVWLDLPADIRLTWDGATLRLDGTLVEERISQLRQQLQRWPVVHQLDLSHLQPPGGDAEIRAALERLIESIDGTRLNFNAGVQLTEAAREALPSLTDNLIQLSQLKMQLSDAEQAQYTIHLQGMSDGVGDGDKNLSLRQARAELVRDLLIAAGVDAAHLNSTAAQEEAPAGYNPALRYVELRVKTQ